MATGDRLRRGRLARAAAALASAALLASAAPGTMALSGEGLGRVRFGMTVRAVEVAVGEKVPVDYPQDDACGVGMAERPHNPEVRYLFEHGRLVRIEVTATPNAPQRPVITVQGIGIGSSEAAALGRFRRAAVLPHQYDEDGHYVDIALSRRHGILFETHRGRITALRAGLYPALLYVEGCL